VADFGVADEGFEGIGTGGWKDLDDSRGEACVGEERSDGESGEGGEFGGLPDGGTSCGEGGSDFFCALGERKVPRGDEGGDSHGAGFDPKLAGAVWVGADSSGEAAGFFPEPLEESCGVLHFGCGLGDWFALFESDDAGEIVFSCKEECGCSLEDFAPLEWGHGLPTRLALGGVGRSGRERGCVGEGDGGEGFGGGWINDFPLLFGIGPCAIEPEFGFKPEIWEGSHGVCVLGSLLESWLEG
jgi:hypothetical protein